MKRLSATLKLIVLFSMVLVSMHSIGQTQESYLQCYSEDRRFLGRAEPKDLQSQKFIDAYGLLQDSQVIILTDDQLMVRNIPNYPKVSPNDKNVVFENLTEAKQFCESLISLCKSSLPASKYIMAEVRYTG